MSYRDPEYSVLRDRELKEAQNAGVDKESAEFLQEVRLAEKIKNGDYFPLRQIPDYDAHKVELLKLGDPINEKTIQSAYVVELSIPDQKATKKLCSKLLNDYGVTCMAIASHPDEKGIDEIYYLVFKDKEDVKKILGRKFSQRLDESLEHLPATEREPDPRDVGRWQDLLRFSKLEGAIGNGDFYPLTRMGGYSNIGNLNLTQEQIEAAYVVDLALPDCPPVQGTNNTNNLRALTLYHCAQYLQNAGISQFSFLGITQPDGVFEVGKIILANKSDAEKLVKTLHASRFNEL